MIEWIRKEEKETGNTVEYWECEIAAFRVLRYRNMHGESYQYQYRYYRDFAWTMVNSFNEAKFAVIEAERQELQCRAEAIDCVVITRKQIDHLQTFITNNTGMMGNIDQILKDGEQ